MQNVTAVQKKTETHMGLLELSPKSIENEVPSTSRHKTRKTTRQICEFNVKPGDKGCRITPSDTCL